MTIDKKQLVELLVEKTSMNEEEIKTQLDQLIERILDAAKRGKALEIKEFGLFYFDEEGELRFDPADELSTEISFKYAGMKPVELKPERDTSIPVEKDTEEKVDEEVDKTEGEDEDDPFTTPFEEPETDDIGEPEEVTKKAEKPAEEDESPFDFESEEDDTKEKEEADVDFISDPFSDEALEPLEEPVEEEEETKRTKIEDIKPATREPVKKKDNTGVFILIAIVIIAVLIGGYFYYIGTQSQSMDETISPTTNQMESGVNESNDTGAEQLNPEESQSGGGETAPNQQMASGNQGTSEQAGSNQSTDDEILSGTGVSVTETDQPMYGLKGTIIEEANNGYSIVVHSFRNENNAMQTAEQLRADGYRVIVSSRTVYENQVWRVSVGQFETLGNAQEAATQLPAPYNTQNFIQRIRIN
ncbi:MAG: SPOR domain-containing protein [Balneolaceae bacterium]|nr:SPOR domain-containing protein [Balneolaceae bacterium]